ncbi:OmpA family protein [Rhodoferax sp. BLA1]|uniref:OmpA family protein n=1 Tax=Rhodoferax sp. BLA1 TaxID=2576062 RepID=UPI0015D3C5C3|nr:OmpA family protein [Rhodoferax sp. BLA1]
MSTQHTHPTFAKLLCWLASALLLSLTGCAKNYVVLLPDDDGTLGQVVVTSGQQTTVLDKKNQGTLMGGTRSETFTVTNEQLQKDFGAALAASPKKPTSYLLYFETGQALLTKASQAEIPVIKEDISHRPGVDVAVIGHSDTKGEAQANYELGLTRAKLVSALISDAGVSTERLSVESHGEKNLLVKTPDDADEPSNRRVEVIVR